MKQKKIFVCGGDLRSQYIAEYFRQKGCYVKTYGLKSNNDESLKDGDFDVVVLGLPAVKEGFVNMPESKEKLSFGELLSFFKGVSLVAGGRFLEEEISLAHSLGVKLFDYSEDEIFMTENALYTAEGTIAELIQNTNRSLCGMKILITGYGRIAKALCTLLSCWPCELTVYARREIHRAICDTRGIKTALNLCNLEPYDCVINTVPADIFTEEAMLTLREDACVLDLSARPGYVNKELCQRMNINLLYLPGIPLKSAPQSAGIAAAKAVERFTEGN